MPEPDEQLLLRFTKGDQLALGELARRYETLLLGLASGLLARRDDLAKEAVQDAWLRVIRSARSFDHRSSFKTWIYRIVINRCHDLREREAKHHSPTPAQDPPLNAPPAPQGRDDLPHLNGAFSALPPERRLVLLLCYHRGLTHEQAADVLGIPLGTLKSRLSTALSELRAALTPPA